MLARSAKHFALSSKRATLRQGIRIPSQNRKWNPKSPPVKYKTGEMNCVALVYRELMRSAEFSKNRISSELLGTACGVHRTKYWQEATRQVTIALISKVSVRPLPACHAFEKQTVAGFTE